MVILMRMTMKIIYIAAVYWFIPLKNQQLLILCWLQNLYSWPLFYQIGLESKQCKSLCQYDDICYPKVHQFDLSSGQVHQHAPDGQMQFPLRPDSLTKRFDVLTLSKWIKWWSSWHLINLHLDPAWLDFTLQIVDKIDLSSHPDYQHSSHFLLVPFTKSSPVFMLYALFLLVCQL